MTVIDHLTRGGIPDAWTPQKLSWLAQAHRHHGLDRYTATQGLQRSNWHRRWAAFIEDILETRRADS